MTWARVTIEAPEGLAKGFEAELARAVKLGVSEGAALLKQGLRDATWRANSGRTRLPMTWRSRVFPEGQDSVNAAGWVDTRAPDLMKVFSEGATISAKGGKWLAIPTDAAGAWGLSMYAGARDTVNTRNMRERVTPRGFERRTGLKLRFVAKGSAFSARTAALVVDQAKRVRKTGIATPYGPGSGSKLYGPAGRTLVVFILVRQVRLKKKLDIAAEARAVQAQVPAMIQRHWRIK